MNLLIIGNGFDLAHGLPTKYTDFLKYCRDYDRAAPVSKASEQNEEFSRFLEENVWLSYFLKITPELDHAGTWIDFEKEIAEAVRELEGAENQFRIIKKIVENGGYEEAKYAEKAEILLTEIKIERGSDDLGLDDIDAIIKLLHRHLRQFARAFEIYCRWVNTLQTDKPISFKLKDRLKEVEQKIKYLEDNRRQEMIKNGYEVYRIMMNEEKEQYSRLLSQITVKDYLCGAGFNYVLSFNYTNTYERLYGNAETKYCYIHGKAQADPEKTSLIFGMDDDLPPGKESSDFKWVSFKKYYQRIIYRTDSKYKDWLAIKPDSRCSEQAIDYVYIVGHSLDRTDWDILYEIFSDPQFRIIVYYYSPADFEDKVQKVIRLLACRGANGRDELVRRFHGSDWSIRFTDQYDEKDGLFVRPKQEQKKGRKAHDIQSVHKFLWNSTE